MKKSLKNNQRRQLLNRQHHKMNARRLSHFNQAMAAESAPQHLHVSSR